MRSVLSTATILLLAACATVPATDGRPARIGELVRVGLLTATPEKVTEDSRCAKGVQCVWAGRVVLSTRIGGAGWYETVPLTLGKPYTTHRQTITLVSVTPEKQAGKIGQGRYRFTFASGT
jgi:starvation-inducible outer membrane lipoprotein